MIGTATVLNGRRACSEDAMAAMFGVNLLVFPDFEGRGVGAVRSGGFRLRFITISVAV